MLRTLSQKVQRSDAGNLKFRRRSSQGYLAEPAIEYRLYTLGEFITDDIDLSGSPTGRSSAVLNAGRINRGIEKRGSLLQDPVSSFG